MNSKLRERESDTFLIECIVHDFIHVKIYIPVISCLSPRTDLNIHTACRKSSQSNHRSRILQYTRICIDNTLQYGFYLLEIFTIFYSEYPFSTTCFLFAVICNGIAAQCTIRNIDDFIIYSCQNSMEYLNFAYSTIRILAFQYSRLP